MIRSFARPSLVPFAMCCSLTAIADDVEVNLQEKHEQAFSRRMENTALIGSFTIGGQDFSSAPHAERYEISSVKKVSGKLWVFTARIKYMKIDATLPITVPVEWAGDTPVVCLTDAAIPGLGNEFSARVVFDGNRYAGTWQHGSVGGHMFGRIEKQKQVDKKPVDDSDQ